MLKLIKYINERGGFGVVPSLEQPIITFPSLKKLFEEFFKNEVGVSESINDIVHMALQERDYATHNFLQWYVAEQIEEEALARILNEKLELIGEDKSGLYLFDRDILAFRTSMEKGGSGGRRH
jgi:ferritin